MNMIAQAASGNEVLRYAVYARFSSVLQNPRSIDDQIELCRTRIAALGGIVTAIYTDSVTTGVTLHRRPGANALLDDAKTGLFDAVFAEALDRISRNQADMADIYRRLEFQEISLVTTEEGNICPMQIGFKGTMNQTFVDNLGNKTRRGHLGVVREGRIPGGLVTAIGWPMSSAPTASPSAACKPFSQPRPRSCGASSRFTSTA